MLRYLFHLYCMTSSSQRYHAWTIGLRRLNGKIPGQMQKESDIILAREDSSNPTWTWGHSWIWEHKATVPLQTTWKWPMQLKKMMFTKRSSYYTSKANKTNLICSDVLRRISSSPPATMRTCQGRMYKVPSEPTANQTETLLPHQLLGQVEWSQPSQNVWRKH